MKLIVLALLTLALFVSGLVFAKEAKKSLYDLKYDGEKCAIQ